MSLSISPAEPEPRVLYHLGGQADDLHEATLAQYPAGYYERPEARAYARINPGWRDNGCYAGFWFRFTPANLAALIRTILHKR